MPVVVSGQSQVWKEYRNLRRWWTGLWLGMIPLGVLLNLVHAVPGAVEFLVGGYFLAFAVITFRITSWRCPRCGKPFMRASWGSMKMTSPLDLMSNRPCKHCDLREGSDTWEES
jgi:hypothetical protein